MFSTRAMTGAFLLLAVAVAGSVAGALAYHHPSPPPVESRAGARPGPAGTRKARAPKPRHPLWRDRAVIKTPGWLPGSVAYSPDGKLLVVGGTGGKVAAFDAATRDEKWKADVGGDFAAVAFSADGKSVLATCTDGVRFLEADTGKLGASLEEKGSRPTAVGAFPDRELVVGGGRKLTSHKVIFGNRQRYFVKQWFDAAAPGTISLSTSAKDKGPLDANAVPLAVAPDGKSVIVTGPPERGTGKNVLWAWVAGDYAKGSPGNRLLRGHDAVVVAAAWSRDGKAAVTGDAAGRVIVWDAKAMKESHRLELGRRVAAVALSADGRDVAAVVVGKQAELHAWEAARPMKGAPILVGPADLSGPIHACLAFSPDGRQLAGSAISTAWLLRGGDLVGNLRVWEAARPRAEDKPGRE